jgi:hypothetical protein
MSIPVICPACDYAFAVPDQYAGKKGKCPKCRAIFRAPSEQAATDAEKPATAAVRRPNSTANPKSRRRQAVSVESLLTEAVETTLKKKATKTKPVAVEDLLGGKETAKEKPKTPVKGAVVAKSLEPADDSVSDSSVFDFADLGPEMKAAQAAFKEERTADSSDGTASGRLARKKNGLPLSWVFTLVAGLVAVALAVFLVVREQTGNVASRTNGENKAKEAQPNGSTPTKSDDEKKIIKKIVGTQVMPTDDAPKREMSVDVWRAMLPAVVRVETVHENGSTMRASGFLVDGAGWVATTYRAVAGGTSAKVVTSEGEFEVAGCVVDSPNDDLVILQVDGDFASAIAPLVISAEAQPTRGHGVFGCRDAYASELETESFEVTDAPFVALLPSHLRPQMGFSLRENGNLRLIEHTGKITEAARGTPLVDYGGRVLGVQIYLGDRAGKGYAVPAAQLRKLLERAHQRAADGNKDPQSLPPEINF